MKKAGKRRRGTGSLQERGPGHWRLRAYNPTTGRQVTLSYTAPDKSRVLVSVKQAMPWRSS